MNGTLSADTNWPKRLILWGALTAVLFIFLWFAFEIVLLAFAGLMLAVLLHACADWVERHTPRGIGFKLSYTVTVLGIVVIFCMIAYLIIPHAISEFSEISKIIPKAMQQVRDTLSQSEWGRYILRIAQRSMSSSGHNDVTSRITGSFADAVEGIIVVAVVGLYGAVNAREDAKGLLRLVPDRKRERVKEVAGKALYTLRWWLLGQLVPMTVLGVATMIGLWLLGVPLAFALGLLTGLMIFVPYVGSWIAFVPTVLVGFTKGVDTALYVTILYLAVHAMEGYVLTPLVQKRAVLLPPVMTILTQLLMWKWMGLLGVAVATPLAAVALALIRVLYLHEDIER